MISRQLLTTLNLPFSLRLEPCREIPYNFAMTIDSIVQALKQEKERIENALVALGDKGGNGRRGRFAGGGVGDGGGRRARRRLSAAVRKKISEAAKARWAKAKKAGKNRL